MATPDVQEIKTEIAALRQQLADEQAACTEWKSRAGIWQDDYLAERDRAARAEQNSKAWQDLATARQQSYERAQGAYERACAQGVDALRRLDAALALLADVAASGNLAPAQAERYAALLDSH